MSMTVSTRIAHKSPSLAKGQRHHDMRQSHIPKYVDQTRTDQNSVLIEPKAEADLRRICLERRAQRTTKRAMKENAAVATIGIITFGKDAQPVIEAMTPEEQDALYLKAAKAIAHRLDTTVTGLVVHRDESAPHAHFQMPAYNANGVPLTNLVSPGVAKELQDIVGRVYGECGITRGTPKAVRIERGDDLSKINNRSVRELHHDHLRELEALQAEIVKQEAKAEKNRRLIQDQEAKLEAGRVTEEQAEGRISAYDRREKDAKAKVAALADEIAEKETKAEKMAQEVDSMEKRHTAITSVMSMIDGPCPVLPLPVTAKLSDGLLKAHTEQIYRPHDVQEFASAITAWAQGAATETLRQKHKNAIAQEAELQRRENTVTKREQVISPREERMGQLESQNKKLLDERLSIGIHLGHMLGVENASMNRGKVIDAIVQTGNLEQFREILRRNRVEMKGHGQGIGS